MPHIRVAPAFAPYLPEAFGLELPTPAGIAEMRALEPEAPLSGCQILVIDDEVGPRESLRILFRARHAVRCVDCVQEGLRAIQAAPPDVIILDIKMPKMNGIEGVQHIRRLDPNVAVIMLTGFGDIESASAAMRNGANDYITKPFNVADLSQLVDYHIRRTWRRRERAQAIAELETLNAQLTETLQQNADLVARGRKSAELIHDLSNPFMVIDAYVQLLREHLQQQAGDFDRQHTDLCVENISAHVKRCRDLFDLWRKTEDTDAYSPTPVRLAAILRDVVSGGNVLAGHKHAVVRLRDGLDDCTVVGDETQLLRCFQNVVANAVQALPARDGVVEVGWRMAGADVEVQIRDNGAGIPPDKLTQIFDLNFTTRRTSGGMGLGLYITRKLVERHRGTISIANNPDCGACTTIRLPLHPAAAPAAAAVGAP